MCRAKCRAPSVSVETLCANHWSTMGSELAQRLDPNGAAVEDRKPRRRIEPDSGCIGRIDGQNESLAVALPSQAQCQTREGQSPAATAHLGDQGDIDNLGVTNLAMQIEEQAANVVASVPREVPQLGPELANGLISGDHVGRFSEAVDPGTVERADVGPFNELGEPIFRLGVER